MSEHLQNRPPTSFAKHVRSALRNSVPVIAAAILFLVPAIVTAGPVLAVEPNNTFATAQVIPASAFTTNFNANIGTGSGGGFVNTSTTIPHVEITRTSGTAGQPDFFRFTTIAAGPIILDIDSNPTNTNFDTVITLLNSGNVPITSNDDNGGDPGDGGGVVGGLFNSRIQTGILPAGDYVVQVRQFGSGGINSSAGSFTLNISAVATPEPGTLTVLGLGLAGLGVAGWRRRKAARASA